MRFVFNCKLYIFRINVCVCVMSSLMNDYYGFFFVFVSIDIGLVYCGAILVIRFVLFYSFLYGGAVIGRHDVDESWVVVIVWIYCSFRE